MGMTSFFAAVDTDTLDLLRAEPERLADYLFPDDDEGSELDNALDIDKAWHGIHYLLTGRADAGAAPLDFLVAGGETVDEAGEYGARLFTAAQTAAIAAALAPIDEATMRARFDPADMKKLKIYPAIWDRDPAEDDALGYCLEYFSELKRFVDDATASGFGLVVSMS